MLRHWLIDILKDTNKAQQGVISSSILLVPFIENQKGGDLLMNRRHVTRWKKRSFTYKNLLFIASGMVLILTILFLCPCAWILTVITGWIIVTYLVITALGMERRR